MAPPCCGRAAKLINQRVLTLIARPGMPPMQPCSCCSATTRFRLRSGPIAGWNKATPSNVTTRTESCACRKSSSDVLVVKSTEEWLGYDPAGDVNATRKRSILVE